MFKKIVLSVVFLTFISGISYSQENEIWTEVVVIQNQQDKIPDVLQIDTRPDDVLPPVDVNQTGFYLDGSIDKLVIYIRIDNSTCPDEKIEIIDFDNSQTVSLADAIKVLQILSGN